LPVNYIINAGGYCFDRQKLVLRVMLCNVIVIGLFRISAEDEMDEKRAGMNLSNLNCSGNSQGCFREEHLRMHKKCE